MTLYQEETFGPTVTVTRVATMDEAIEKANGTRYALGSTVFSKEHGMAIAQRLRAGMTAINGVISFAGIPTLPFGGVGDSGFGRIHGPDGLKEFTYPHAIARQRFKPPMALTSFTRTAKTDGQGRCDRYSKRRAAEICERFIETGMTVTPELKALLRKSADVVAARLRSAAINFSAEPPRDDIAVLVLRNDAMLDRFRDVFGCPVHDIYAASECFPIATYDPRRDPRAATADGRPVLNTGGSSSGAGTAANFWAANVGTETSGSILSPANQNMLAAIKPTVGRISRYGVIPITADQEGHQVIQDYLEGEGSSLEDEGLHYAQGWYTMHVMAEGI